MGINVCLRNRYSSNAKRPSIGDFKALKMHSQMSWQERFFQDESERPTPTTSHSLRFQAQSKWISTTSSILLTSLAMLQGTSSIKLDSVRILSD
jgi:hypothetical protein